MHIYATHLSTQRCAETLDDATLCRQILYVAAILNGSIIMSKGAGFLPVKHLFHPCVCWTRETPDQYRWTLSLFKECLKEFEHRFGFAHGFHEHLDQATKGLILITAPKGFRALPNGAIDQNLDVDYTDLPVYEAYKRLLIDIWESHWGARTWSRREKPSFYKKEKM